MKCCVCGKEFKGHGNNPWPLVKTEGSRCCDKCNSKVLVARFAETMKQDKEVKNA